MNKKELLKFFCYMFLAICLIALIILGICSFFYYLVPFDFPGTVGEWITSLSTLAGGALTLIGVIWTINYEKKAREEDASNQEIHEEKHLANRYKPFLSPIKVINIKGTELERNSMGEHIKNEYGNTINILDYTTHDKYVDIPIENKGRGEAIIKKVTISQLEKKSDYITVKQAKERSNCVFPNQNYYLSLDISIEKYDEVARKGKYFDYLATIEYTDFLEVHNYTKKIHIQFISTVYNIDECNVQPNINICIQELSDYY